MRLRVSTRWSSFSWHHITVRGTTYYVKLPTYTSINDKCCCIWALFQPPDAWNRTFTYSSYRFWSSNRSELKSEVLRVMHRPFSAKGESQCEKASLCWCYALSSWAPCPLCPSYQPVRWVVTQSNKAESSSKSHSFTSSGGANLIRHRYPLTHP